MAMPMPMPVTHRGRMKGSLRLKKGGQLKMTEDGLLPWNEEGLENAGGPSDSLFLAGDIRASGRNVEEVRDQLAQRLSKFIPDLVVSVSVIQLSGNKVFVIGQVNKPGEITLVRPIDVTQALAISGGVTPFASVNDIKVLRRTPTGQSAIEFRYGDIEKGKRLEQNILLSAGDVVVVP